jgi:hypothetical protein
MMHRIASLGMVALALAALSLTACSSAPRYNVDVALDREAWQAARGDDMYDVEVDLVAVNESEKPLWENYDIGKYFQANNTFRQDADRHTMTFTADDPQPKRLSKNNPIWREKWNPKDPTHLVVVANLRDAEPLPGGVDPRRIIIPLDPEYWQADDDTLEVKVRSSSVINTTRRNPKYGEEGFKLF